DCFQGRHRHGRVHWLVVPGFRQPHADPGGWLRGPCRPARIGHGALSGSATAGRANRCAAGTTNLLRRDRPTDSAWLFWVHLERPHPRLGPMARRSTCGDFLGRIGIGAGIRLARSDSRSPDPVPLLDLCCSDRSTIPGQCVNRRRETPMATVERPTTVRIDGIGDAIVGAIAAFGDLAIFAGRAFSWAFWRRPGSRTLLPVFYAVGVRSVPVVSI